MKKLSTLRRGKLYLQQQHANQTGRVGYVVMWLMGVPVTLILFLWLITRNLSLA